MALIDVLRSGVKIIDTVVDSLQSTVTLERFFVDESGQPDHLPPVTLKALVDWRQKQVRTATGVLSVSRANVMFVDVAELSAATPDIGQGKGINDNDIITLPDGTTGPILDMAGFIDPGTAEPLATEVWIG